MSSGYVAKALKSYQRRVNNSAEKRLERLVTKQEKEEEKTRKRIRRYEYLSGAANSPTNPPAKSKSRDKNTLKLLEVISACSYSKVPVMRVRRLSENLLHAQDLVDEKHLKFSRMTVSQLDDDLADATAAHDLAKMERLLRLLKQLTALREQASKGRPIRVYGWDKTTVLLQSYFYALAMSEDFSRPFTVNPDEETLRRAKSAKSSAASHLQDRLARLLRNRFNGKVPDFWFVFETGFITAPHLHGAIDWPSDETEQSKLNDALRVWAGGTAPNRAVVSDPLSQSGWVQYCLKHCLTTEKRIEGRILSSTVGVKKRARELYDEFHGTYRATLERHRSASGK